MLQTLTAATTPGWCYHAKTPWETLQPLVVTKNSWLMIHPLAVTCTTNSPGVINVHWTWLTSALVSLRTWTPRCSSSPRQDVLTRLLARSILFHRDLSPLKYQILKSLALVGLVKKYPSNVYVISFTHLFYENYASENSFVGMIHRLHVHIEDSDLPSI